MSQTRSLHKAPRGGDLFVFGIPLRPKCRTADWDGAVRRFRSALLSCLAQTDPDFRVLVACNERPEGMPDDPRVEYLILDRPQSGPEPGPMEDKGAKIQAIAIRLRELGGGALMLVDDDDMVSRRVVEHVRAHPDVDSFIAYWGFEYDVTRDRLRCSPRFHRNCGTCAVLRFRADELPSRMDEPEEQFLVRAGHHRFRDLSVAGGRRLGSFPFGVALYRLGHGVNHSLSAAGEVGWRRRVMRVLFPSFRPAARHRRDFSLCPDLE